MYRILDRQFLTHCFLISNNNKTNDSLCNIRYRSDYLQSKTVSLARKTIWNEIKIYGTSIFYSLEIEYPVRLVTVIVFFFSTKYSCSVHTTFQGSEKSLTFLARVDLVNWRCNNPCQFQVSIFGSKPTFLLMDKSAKIVPAKDNDYQHENVSSGTVLICQKKKTVVV